MEALNALPEKGRKMLLAISSPNAANLIFTSSVDPCTLTRRDGALRAVHIFSNLGEDFLSAKYSVRCR